MLNHRSRLVLAFLAGATLSVTQGCSEAGSEAPDSAPQTASSSSSSGEGGSSGERSSSGNAISSSSGAGGSSGNGSSSGGSSGNGSSSGEQPVLPEGREVLVYVGDQGGGPTSEAKPEEIASMYRAAGYGAAVAAEVPADFAARVGTLILLNPRAESLSSSIRAAVVDLLQRGGRAVLVMEHCRNGCHGSAPAHNQLLEQLASTLRFDGTVGSSTVLSPLQVLDTPISSSNDELAVYYSGAVRGGTPVGNAGDETVIAYERIERGDVVAIADLTVWGYSLAEGDNERFLTDLAALERQ